MGREVIGRRSLLVHWLILAALAGLGVALTGVDALTGEGGWLLARFTVSRLYWLAFGAYALVSTLDVLAVAAFQAMRRRALTPVAVVLAHVVPVLLIGILLNLGVHDWVQDALRERPAATSGGDAGGSGTRVPQVAPAPSDRVMPSKPAETDRPRSQEPHRD